MATITLTAGDYFGLIQGYSRVESSLGATGSISAEPFAGFTVDTLITGASPGYDALTLVGDTTGTFTDTSFTVNGNTWTIGVGSYDSGITTYALTPSGGEFVNGVAYTIVTGSGGPVAPNITSPATVQNLVDTTLAHTITADKTIASTAITGGADAAAFEINGTSTLRFAGNAVSDALGPLVVNVEITDTDGLTDTQTITVTVEAIQIVGAMTWGRAGATSTVSVTFALTGGIASTPAIGDVVVVFLHVGGAADVNLGVNTGYTELLDAYQNGTTQDSNLGVYIKRLTAADTTFSVTSSGSTNYAQNAYVLVLRGVDATTPLDVALVSAGLAGAGKPNPPAITPITTGAVIVAGGGLAIATGAAFASSDLTDFRTLSTADTNDSVVGGGYKKWTGGSFDPAVWTGGGTDSSSNSWNAATLAFRPAWTAPGGPITGTLVAQESGTDSLTGSGTVAITGTLVAIETGSDTYSGAATVTVTAVLAAQESGTDSLTATGIVAPIGIVGALAAVETGNDTYSGAGTVSVVGTLATVETGGDSLTGSGTTAITGTLTATETGADTFDASGSVAPIGIVGSMLAVETGSDVLTATGDVGPAPITGTLTAQETGNDTCSVVGTVDVTALLVARESGSDSFAADLTAAITGMFAVTETGSDVLTANGYVVAGIIGAMVAVETGSDQGWHIPATMDSLSASQSRASASGQQDRSSRAAVQSRASVSALQERSSVAADQLRASVSAQQNRSS